MYTKIIRICDSTEMKHKSYEYICKHTKKRAVTFCSPILMTIRYSPFFACARHGIYLAGESPVTGSCRQV